MPLRDERFHLLHFVRAGRPLVVVAHHLAPDRGMADRGEHVERRRVRGAACRDTRRSATASCRPVRRTTVVMPCEICVGASGSVSRPSVEWLCGSMNPGASARPCASMTTSLPLGLTLPTSAIRPSLTRNPPARGGAPVPSTSMRVEDDERRGARDGVWRACRARRWRSADEAGGERVANSAADEAGLSVSKRTTNAAPSAQLPVRSVPSVRIQSPMSSSVTRGTGR